VRAFPAVEEVAPMWKAVAGIPEEQHFVLSNLSPGPTQKRLALAVVLGLLVAVFIIAGPLSSVYPGRVDAFVPVYSTAMFVNESITAILLFAQFSILRSRAILVIACGYLYTALILILWILTFPGVFAQTSLIGGLQSTVWLYFFWHVGFPMFVIGYALSKDADAGRRFWRGTVRAAIALSVASTVAVVSAVAFICIAGEALLPRVALDSVHLSSLGPYVGVPVTLLSVFALIVLWFRRRSMLDLWLMVVMCLYSIEILNYYPSSARYSLGWYGVRVMGFLSSSLVLVVLLYEITNLYGRLLAAVLAQRREREARLVTGDAVAATIAHEIRQPLSAMITRSDTGLRWLDRSIPDLDKAKENFKQIAADGHRAGAMIESIRANFKKDARIRASLDVNDLIAEALALVRNDLQSHRILLKAEPNAKLPRVMGDRIQLQQVLLNLITNAIDSMAAKDDPRVLRVRSEVRDDGDVVVSVEDTGTGISSEDVERIFNPLFTTKSGGMGMGLAICRSIIEAHEGQLWVVSNTREGTVFQFALRGDAAMSSVSHEGAQSGFREDSDPPSRAYTRRMEGP
jgi:signal transduction histidine kinase